MKGCTSTQIAHLRQELLRKQFKGASEAKKARLAELQGILRKKLLTLRRAARLGWRTKDRAKKRAALLANPFGFYQTTDSPETEQPYHMLNKRDNYLSITYSDALWEDDLGECRGLINPGADPVVCLTWSKVVPQAS